MVRASEGYVRGLLEGNRQYRIPLYQRPYQWTTTQWQTLWNDLAESVLPDDEPNPDPDFTHFIGAMVLVPVESSALSVSRFLVVDGQQRLTTLTLLLAAVRDYHHARGHEERAQMVHNQYLINQYQKDDSRQKFIPTQTDRESYTGVALQIPAAAAEDRIGEAYRFFRAKLEPLEEQQVEELELFILNRLSIVEITTHPEDNVHRIFQSLNNTGLKLTQGDLIRNLIFMYLGDAADEVYQRYWHPMEQTLPSNKALEDLFWLDLLSDNATLRQDSTFNAYQKRLSRIESQAGLVEEIKRIAELAKVYALILDPTREASGEVRYQLERLKAWKLTTPHVLMLEILRRRELGEVTSNDAAKALATIESFLVRRLVVGQSTQGLNRVFPQVRNQLADGTPIADQVFQLLSSGRRHFATDAEIKRAVVESPFFHRGRAEHRKVFLTWLEESFGSKEPIDTKTLSIEHVMPQTLDADWRAELINQVGEDNYTEEFNATVHTLGNLTLTGYNSEMGNNAFGIKRKEYEKTGLRLSQDLVAEDTWGPEAIKQRSLRLAEQIITTWPGPTKSEEPDTAPMWRLVNEIVASIPRGSWASYGDVASAAGSWAQIVGNYLATKPVLNGHRVLKADGSVAPNFAWLDPNETRSPKEVLESEGLTFDGARAAADKRVPVSELLAFIGTEDPE